MKNFRFFLESIIFKTTSHFFLYVCNSFTNFYLDRSKLLEFFSTQLKKREENTLECLIGIEYLYLSYLVTNTCLTGKILNSNNKCLSQKSIRKKYFSTHLHLVFSDFLFLNCRILGEKSKFLYYLHKSLKCNSKAKKFIEVNKKNLFLRNDCLLYFYQIYKIFNISKIYEKNITISNEKFLGCPLFLDNLVKKSIEGSKGQFKGKEIDSVEKILKKRLKKIKMVYLDHERATLIYWMNEKKEISLTNHILSIFKVHANKLMSFFWKDAKRFGEIKNQFGLTKKGIRLMFNFSLISMQKSKNKIERRIEFIFPKANIYCKKELDFFILKKCNFLSKNIYLFNGLCAFSLISKKKQKKKVENAVVIKIKKKNLSNKEFPSSNTSKWSGRKIRTIFKRITKVRLSDMKKNHLKSKLLFLCYRILDINVHFISLKNSIIFELESTFAIIENVKIYDSFLEIFLKKFEKIFKICLRYAENYLIKFLTLEKIKNHQFFILQKKNQKKLVFSSKKSLFSKNRKKRRVKKLEKKLNKADKNFACINWLTENKILEILKKRINCPINVFSPKEVVLINCGHLFSSICIKDLMVSRNRKCPLCRKVFSSQQVKPIFLN